MFGQAPDFADSDVAVYHFDNTIIKLEKESAARDRIAPAAVAAQSAGSRVVFAIWVDDVDAACAQLAQPDAQGFAAQRSDKPVLGNAQRALR